MDLNEKALHFANSFIATEHIDNAEILAAKILEKIRENKKQLRQKYGDKK